MRAIDADALKEDLRMGKECDIDCPTDWKACHYDRVYAKQDFCEWIDDAPTIEPRKKGRWIKKTIKKKIENDYSCSECGRHVSVMRGYDVRLVYPFCHCGAEMTEGEG